MAFLCLRASWIRGDYPRGSACRPVWRTWSLQGLAARCGCRSQPPRVACARHSEARVFVRLLVFLCYILSGWRVALGRKPPFSGCWRHRGFRLLQSWHPVVPAPRSVCANLAEADNKFASGGECNVDTSSREIAPAHFHATPASHAGDLWLPC